MPVKTLDHRLRDRQQYDFWSYQRRRCRSGGAARALTKFRLAKAAIAGMAENRQLFEMTRSSATTRRIPEVR
jgi:hypothetical protein